MSLRPKSLLDRVAAPGPSRGFNGLLGPSTGDTPAPGANGRSFYDDPNEDLDAKLQGYFGRVNAGSPGSIRDLYNTLRADGIDVEIKGEENVELLRFPGHDWGWMDLRQDKAAIEGRRGWESAKWTSSQRWYGSEDFDRLVAQGRNPHTGAQVGLAAARLFTRHSDSPMGGGFDGSAMGGGIAGAMDGRRPRSARTFQGGRQSTILAGMTAKAPKTRTTVLGGLLMATTPDKPTKRDAITKRQQYETLKSTLFSERSTFDAHWREIADYTMPRRTRWFVKDRNKGDRRSQFIIDSTAVKALDTLKSGLHAGLTSPARPWMRLTTPDPSLAEAPGVKTWLHQVTQRMLTAFARSNLYNALPIVYGDMGGFATAAMSVMEDTRDLFRCYTYPVGSFAMGLDARGLVTTFVREYELTVRQLVEEFGRPDGGTDIDWSRFSQSVKTLWDAGSYDQGIDVCWFVTPNVDAKPGAMEARTAYPWSSCWIETGRDQDGTYLRESGYREFPLMCPRWDVTSAEDTYGTMSPGMMALGDVKALQLMQKRKAQAVEKGINPPMQGPSSLRNQKVSLIAGDMTYVDQREGMQGLRPVHDVNASIAELGEDIREHQYRIRQAYYADLFLMLANSNSSRGAQPVTAREIEERHEEKLLALGPVLERTNDELLDPLVDRVFAMMMRAGLVPPPPQELEGVDLKVEYISVMAQAQKAVAVVATDRFFQSVMALGQGFPEVRHKVDALQGVDDYGEMLGVNPKLIRSDEEAAERMGAEQQAIAKQQQALEMESRAKSAKTMSETNLEGDTALARLVGA